MKSKIVRIEGGLPPGNRALLRDNVGQWFILPDWLMLKAFPKKKVTLLETNISDRKALLKMIFLFPRRVY